VTLGKHVSAQEMEDGIAPDENCNISHFTLVMSLIQTKALFIPFQDYNILFFEYLFLLSLSVHLIKKKTNKNNNNNQF
jgi:hypothetical protein